MRLIDADKAKENYCNKCLLDPEKCGGKCSVLSFLNRQEMVDPVKHGHWTNINSNSSFGLAIGGRCSECRLYSGLWTKNQPYKYCPYCGAKMDKEV